MITLDEKYTRKIKKELKGKTHKELIEIVVHMEQLLFNADHKLEVLLNTGAERDANYLSRCRSVGGVTLPPGM